jgi:tetratricopeptide (TPR) repeat protein
MELGLIELWDRENPKGAIPLLQLALKTSPLRPPSNWLAFGYWCLSWAFVMTCKTKAAVKAGKKALRAVDFKQSDYEAALFNAHYVLGVAYSDIVNKQGLAIHHYLQALDLKQDPEAYRYLAGLYLQKGELGQALETYEAILRIAPHYSRLGDIHDGMGVCLAQMKRFEEALTHFERAREEQATISFKPSEIFNNMGVTYWHLGRYGEAVEAFKTALHLMHPEDKDYDRIEGYLREAQSQRPPPPT